ncbi:MAG: hypothetical protein WAV41_02045 [Microgenomates group bacterium]
MRDKKFWILLGGLLIVFLTLIFWPNKTINNKTQLQLNNIVEPVADFAMNSPKIIDWGGVVEKKYNSIKVLVVEPKQIDINQKIEIRNSLSKEIYNTNITFNFDDNRNIFEFDNAIKFPNQIERGDKQVGEIKTMFLENMKNLGNILNFDYKVEKVNYKQFLSPWWISGNEKEYDALEVLANYYYENIPIKTFEGYMIKSDYFGNGKLVKTENHLPFERVQKTIDKQTLTISELRNLPINNYKIWRVEGGSKLELSGEDPVIDMVKVNSYELEYIYDVKTNVVWPYYFIVGESDLPTGKAEITLIVSAIK